MIQNRTCPDAAPTPISSSVAATRRIMVLFISIVHAQVLTSEDRRHALHLPVSPIPPPNSSFVPKIVLLGFDWNPSKSHEISRIVIPAKAGIQGAEGVARMARQMARQQPCRHFHALVCRPAPYGDERLL